MDREIRVGVFGTGRGEVFARTAGDAGMQLVALCDWNEEALGRVCQRHRSVARYADFDAFLQHDMDAVVLANYFQQHAPYAIRALEAGRHVLSETTACKTLAEGVALCEAVERTGHIFMLAENYPYSAAACELRRLYQNGEIGKVRYAEGEYNHPGETAWWLRLSPGLDHWRNWVPPTYYCTHALGPLLHVINEWPVSVNGQAMIDEGAQSPATTKVCDSGGVMLVRTDGGAVLRIFGLTIGSVHRVRYEFHGEQGFMGTCDPDHWRWVRVRHEPFQKPRDGTLDRLYAPDWPEHGDLTRKSGHGGGDFWTNYHFAQAIRAGKQPFFDVYRSVAMAAVGILGWRSCLEGSRTFRIPDFRDAAARRAVADDHASPFAEDRHREDHLPPSIRGYVPPSEEAIAFARRIWEGAE